MAMLVIERQASPGIFELLRQLDGMRIVVTQYPLTIRFMQSQAIANAMRYLGCRRDPVRFEFDPIAAPLIDDLTVQIQQGLDAGVKLHAQRISSDDISFMHSRQFKSNRGAFDNA
jgi:hypothetical protein